ncbi:hypothetical protein BU24DRAFT_360743 [Aaosphaeria arxii CBS 175.79]|uniref:Rhodopsin domain-containing protein n=1 Tax=Aaosphaeria arxii CBS 175.79 TaxID=1450172 RepID=A0A6A5Y6B9_9PLEO|nr:uncharacterized protein BU24DRAFT_360743 [Aaosphaeria arxii CBS 175.79]KAF2020340.1 hypothetical protein BU24DRAFT_360743 [Aaosphaeria arxii CBS 175.79]
MANSGLGQVVSWYICTIAAVPFVGLRMHTRWTRFGGLAIEDYLIILALLCLIGDLVIQQHMWNLGLGNMATITPAHFKELMQMIVPGSILYVSSLWAVKFALVLLYKRLAFPGSKLILLYNIALGGLVATYLVIFFDIIFQCYPHDKRWSTDPKYQCDKKASNINFWITILFNIFSDIIIMCLPISMVLRLQMKPKQKLAVAGVFALGLFVIISSIIRAYYSSRNETMLTCTVSMVETTIAIIVSCLPALRAMILGNTQHDTSSYGKHYELSSARRRTNDNRMNLHMSGGLQTQRTKNNPHGSEDSLVTGKLSVTSGLGVLPEPNDKGFTETNVQPVNQLENGAGSSKSIA